MAELEDVQPGQQYSGTEHAPASVDFPGADSDTVSQFAEDLRALRHANDYPKLTTMQFHTGISKSTISAALKGDRLPSEKTVRALASFFRADVVAWSRRRSLLDQKTPRAQTEPEVGLNPNTGLLQTPSAHVEHDEHPNHRGPDLPDASSPRPSTPAPIAVRRLLIVTAAIAALVTATITSLIWMAISAERTGAQASTVEHYVDFADGVDPMLTVCRKDSAVAAAEEQLDGGVFIEMMYSARCQAVWGRVTRYDGQTANNAISMKIYPNDGPSSSRAQERQTTGAQSVYTSMLVRTSKDTRICGVASIAQGDSILDTSPPVCI